TRLLPSIVSVPTSVWLPGRPPKSFACPGRQNSRCSEGVSSKTTEPFSSPSSGTNSAPAISTDHLIDVRSSSTEPDFLLSRGPVPSSMPPSLPGSGTSTVFPGTVNFRFFASVYLTTSDSIHQLPPTSSLPARSEEHTSELQSRFDLV